MNRKTVNPKSFSFLKGGDVTTLEGADEEPLGMERERERTERELY